MRRDLKQDVCEDDLDLETVIRDPEISQILDGIISGPKTNDAVVTVISDQDTRVSEEAPEVTLS